MCGKCESCHDRTVGLVVKGQSARLFVPSVIKTHIPLTDEILHNQKIYCKDIENELKSYHNKTDWVNFVLMQDSWPQLTVFHDERHWRILTSHRFSGLSWVHIAKKRRFIWTKRLDSWEHQNWTRIGSYNLLPARNQNWVCKQRQFSLVGQNFSWIEQVGHGLDRQRVRRQRAGDLWNEDGSICVEDGSICSCKPIKGQSKTKKNNLCLLIYKNCTYSCTAGGQNSSKERQTVFFTAVNLMNKDHRDPQELDLTKPRLASYKQKWKRHQDTVYWVDMQLAQQKGLKFYQTRCNAIACLPWVPECLPWVPACIGCLDRPRRLPNTKKRHSKVKLTLLKSSQPKVHSQPRRVVAVPSGRRTSFVGSDVHNPTTSTGTCIAGHTWKIDWFTIVRSVEWSSECSSKLLWEHLSESAAFAVHMHDAESDLFTFKNWVMFVFAAVTTQRHGTDETPYHLTERKGWA